MPDLKGVVQGRFPQSKIVYGEFIAGLDGKMRYFKPLRMKIYRAIAQAIRAHAPDVCLYFCMEDDEVWQDALGFTPGRARRSDPHAGRGRRAAVRTQRRRPPALSWRIDP